VSILSCLAEVATFMEIDHDAHQVFTETIRVLPLQSDASIMQPSEDAVAARLTAPIVTTFIDTEKITFERLVFFCISIIVSCIRVGRIAIRRRRGLASKQINCEIMTRPETF